MNQETTMRIDVDELRKELLEESYGAFFGGGFGGCTVSIVKNDVIDKFIEVVGNGYTEKLGRKAEFYVVEIGGGASVCQF